MARKPTTTARMSQAMRHPFSPYLSMMKGTSRATTTRPTEAPVEAVPVATPRRRCENHRASMVCAGMFAAAAPAPERKRPPNAIGYPTESPVMTMPTQASSSPVGTTRRGPKREASAPPMMAMAI